jgi:hypothetical protein
MKKMLNARVDESIKARLPRANGPNAPTPPSPAGTRSPSPARLNQANNGPPTAPRLLDDRQPDFAHVNIILIAILLIVLQDARRQLG